MNRSGLRRWVVVFCMGVLLQGVHAAKDPFDIPALPRKVIGADYFGVHVHHLRSRGRPKDPPQPTPFPAEVAGALRLWDSTTRWADIQPTADRWEFARMDAYVQTARRHGAKVVLTLGSTPQWASARPNEPCSYGFGCSAEPAHLSDWDRYVAKVAERYRGQVDWYEIWNEPHPGQRYEGHRGFFTGELEDLLELARRASVVIRQIDPNAKILTPGFVNRLPLLEKYLRAGGSEYADGLAYHLYSTGDRHLVEQIRELGIILKRLDLSHWSVLNTESSYSRWPADKEVPPGVKAYDGPTAAAMFAHSMILGAFSGIEGWYLHAWDNEVSGAVDRELRPTALMASYVSVRRWLLGLTPLGCRTTVGQLVRCEGRQRDGGRQLLVWRPDPGPAVRLRLSGVSRIEFVDRAAQDVLNEGSGEVDVGLQPVAIWLHPPK